MHLAHSSFERMMDAIAAAESIAELEYLRGAVSRDFAVHASERDELKRTLDAMRQLLARGRGPKPTARPSPRVGDSGGVLQP
jgi:hypothetical protein